MDRLFFPAVLRIVVPRLADLPGRDQPVAEEAGKPPEGDGNIRVLMTTITIVLILTVTPTAFAHHYRHHVPGKGDQSWQWEWRVWLPDKWQRIGACETGYGKRPGRWDWNSGTYQGAFGFYHVSWDRFKPVASWPSEAYLASPWQQYRTALAIWRRYGFSGWGCRNA